MSAPDAQKPINLNRARKDKARAEAKLEAAANAQKFGRSKAQTVLEATRKAQAKRMLDAHKREEQ